MPRSTPIRGAVATVIIGVATALSVAACGGATSASATHSSSATQSASSTAAAHSTSSAAAAGPVNVSISMYAFHPATLTVAPGTKVTFTNHDQTAHTATTTGSGFDTGTVPPGKSATVTLSKPGTYAYVCQFHPFMHGTIIVRS
jgi:plastocyanin